MSVSINTEKVSGLSVKPQKPWYESIFCVWNCQPTVSQLSEVSARCCLYI